MPPFPYSLGSQVLSSEATFQEDTTASRISPCLGVISHALTTVPYDRSITSSLIPEAWERALSSISDKPFVEFLLHGISNGFRISVAEGHPFQPAKRNLKSAYDHPKVVAGYLKQEVMFCRLAQVPSALTLDPLLIQTSPFGVIHKHKPDKWHMIVNLSSPKGSSVNDAISRELCRVTYTSIDHAVALARGLGRGALLAKLNLKDAYRAVPVHPSDQRLLAVSWKRSIFIDKALPFGLRSAPKIFSALTDSMMWILHERGVAAAVHHLDDCDAWPPRSSPM